MERPTVSDESTASGDGGDFWAWLKAKLDGFKTWLSGDGGEEGKQPTDG